MTRSKRTILAAALAVLLPISLTACGEDADDGGDVLRLWHYEGPNSAMGVAWAEAIKQFEAAHPGVKVEFEEKGFEQIRQNASIILNSDDAPDVMEYNKGNATAGLLSKQGLLTDLTAEANERGWAQMLGPSVQATSRYENGIMGSGNWYGVTNYGEYVMVYYNKDLFAKHNVAVPTTFEQFTAAMDAFVKAGVTPLSVGGAEYPAQQIFYLLALSKAHRNFVDSYQHYRGPVDFKGPELSYAANTFADWVRKGYLDKNAAGLNAEDMGVFFTRGRSPMMISGSWWYGRLASEITNFEWDTFLFPGNTLHPGSGGNLWVVPAKAKNKELAYDFIDITLQPQIQNLLGNSGGVPVLVDTGSISDPKSRALADKFNTINSADGLAFYPDWPAPGYYDVLVAAIQNLINGKKSPEQVLDELAKPYREHLTSIGK